MEKIASFTIDHEKLEKGLYLSRIDNGVITLDLRIRQPYKDTLLTNSEMHSLEHILATVLRNGAYKESVVYAGPMGCQTGFYVLFSGISEKQAVEETVRAFKTIAGTDIPMPGDTAKECGNYKNLNTAAARVVAREYYGVIKGKTECDKYKC